MEMEGGQRILQWMDVRFWRGFCIATWAFHGAATCPGVSVVARRFSVGGEDEIVEGMDWIFSLLGGGLCKMHGPAYLDCTVIDTQMNMYDQ